MTPIDLLVSEHRVIERVVTIVRPESERIRHSSRVDPVFVDTVVDFFRTYTDWTHHGKEEGILFRDLANKALSPEDQKAMEGLIEGHRYARQTVGELDEARQGYLLGRATALEVIADKLDALVRFYPGHIRVEDQHFFPASLGYLTAAEQAAMLAEFEEWDRRMIHEKYRAVVEGLEQSARPVAEAPTGARML